MTEPTTITELEALYDCEWLEDRGQFSRVTTSPEESAWFCKECGSLECDPYENVCYNCGEEDEE